MILQIDIPTLDELTCQDCPCHDWEWDMCSAIKLITKCVDDDASLFDVLADDRHPNCPVVILRKEEDDGTGCKS